MTEATHTTVVQITGQNTSMQSGGIGSAATFFCNSICTVQTNSANAGLFADAAGQPAITLDLNNQTLPFQPSPGDMYTLTLTPYTPPAS